MKVRVSYALNFQVYPLRGKTPNNTRPPHLLVFLINFADISAT